MGFFHDGASRLSPIEVPRAWLREEDGPEGCTFTSRNCSTDNSAAKWLRSTAHFTFDLQQAPTPDYKRSSFHDTHNCRISSSPTKSSAGRKQPTCPYSRQTVEVVREAPEKPASRRSRRKQNSAAHFPQADFWTISVKAGFPIGCCSGITYHMAISRQLSTGLATRQISSGTTIWDRQCLNVLRRAGLQAHIHSRIGWSQRLSPSAP